MKTQERIDALKEYAKQHGLHFDIRGDANDTEPGKLSNDSWQHYETGWEGSLTDFPEWGRYMDPCRFCDPADAIGVTWAILRRCWAHTFSD